MNTQPSSFHTTLRNAAGRFPAAFAVAALYALAALCMGDHIITLDAFLLIALETLLAGALSALAGLLAECRGWSRRTGAALQVAVLAVFAGRVAWGWGDSPDEFFVVSRLALASTAAALAAWALGALQERPADAAPRLAIAATVGGAAMLGLHLGALALAAVLSTLFGASSGVWDWVGRFAMGPAVAAGALLALAWATSEKPFAMPPAWRLLLKWVALPVHAAFTAVLLVYFLWCAVRWDLPNGEIASFATCAGLGWVALSLLVGGEEGRRTRLYARRGGLAVLPLTALQFVAIGIRVGQYGLTPVRCAGFAVAAFVALYALAAAARPAFPSRWGWGWMALVLFAAGASPWNAVDVGIGAQFRRLDAFRARREAGETFDAPTRAAIMGAWDATVNYELRGGHYRRCRSQRFPVFQQAFREEWEFQWLSPRDRRDLEKQTDAMLGQLRWFNYYVERVNCDAVAACPFAAAAVRPCRLGLDDGRIVVQAAGLPPFEATDAVMGAWNDDGTHPLVIAADLGNGNWLLLDNTHVQVREKPDGTRTFEQVSGNGWLFTYPEPLPPEPESLSGP